MGIERITNSRAYDLMFDITIVTLIMIWIGLFIDMIIDYIPPLPDQNVDWVILVSIWILIILYVSRRK